MANGQDMSTFTHNNQFLVIIHSMDECKMLSKDFVNTQDKTEFNVTRSQKVYL